MLTALVCLLLVPADRAPRAFVLDAGAGALVAVDVARGEVVGTVPLDGAPGSMVRSPDLSRIVVFDRSPGKMTSRFGFKPSGRTGATIVDAVAFQKIARVDVGYNPQTGSDALFTPDGRRLAVMCSGYHSKNPAETLPRELVTLDVETGQVAGRLEIDRELGPLRPIANGGGAVALAAAADPEGAAPALPAEAFVLDLSEARLLARVRLEGAPEAPIVAPDGQHVAFFSMRVAEKKKPLRPATLQLMDVPTREIPVALTLDGAPEQAGFAPDGHWFYLLERGRPSKKPEQNINGRLQVVNVETHAHEVNLEVGSDPQGLIGDVEGNQTLLLSDGPPSRETSRKEGELRVIRGADVASLVKVAASPNFLRFSPDRKVAYVVGDRGLTYVDFVEMRPLGETPLSPAGMNVLSADDGEKHLVDELAISQDGAHAFALYRGSSRLSVLDLDKRMFVGQVNTGRGGVKFGKFMGALAASAALTALSYQSGLSAAQASGARYFTFDVYFYRPHAPTTSIAVRPDGDFAYVLNPQTNDVTVVDAHRGAAVEKIAAGGRGVRVFRGGTTLAVHGRETLHLIDAAHNKDGPDLAFPGAKGGSVLVFSADGRHAVAAGGSAVYCLDGVTGEVRGRALGFRAASQVIVEGAEPEAEEDVSSE